MKTDDFYSPKPIINMPESGKKDITLFEVSYEVCNKVGGIYTVITSKLDRVLEQVDNYFAIGPYYEKKAAVAFEHEKPPAKISRAFRNLNKKYGINCYYGKWITKGKEPATILIDPAGFRDQLNDIKAKLWEFAKVDSMSDDQWYDEPLPWAYSAGMVIDELIKQGAVKGKVVAHFHEYLSGAGLLYLKSHKTPVGTVFTTHATMLGRSIAGTGKEDIHAMIRDGLAKKQTIPDDKAREYSAVSKHSMEKATARLTDVFTSVSNVTGRECEFILGRKPDVLLYNGLDTAKFPPMEELSNQHIQYRDHIRRFLSAYFSPYYPIDADDTLLFFISGRFEYRNKGIDMFMDALGRLNQKLRKEKSTKTVVAFFWVPCDTKGRRHDVMDNLALFDDLRESVEKESRKVGSRIMDAFAERKPLNSTALIDKGFLQLLKRTGLSFRREGNAPVSPFVMEENDITRGMERNGLNNSKVDHVKVIYYPTYLSSTDGILGLDYFNAMKACHVGIFPSYYEPWGYTPLEAAAQGCQSITTDLAGYGKYMKPRLPKNDYSLMVIPRENKGYEESLAYLEDLLYKIYKMSKGERGMFKMKAKQLAKLADWKELISNYMKAYDLALKKK